jgi:para-nitrobenzyl esterase
MANTATDRRQFLRQASLLTASLGANALFPLDSFGFSPQTAAGTQVIGETSFGRIRGTEVRGIKIFKGVPYGASTSGRNRFRPAVDPTPWTGVRDALQYGPTAPQTEPARRAPQAALPAESEDCLVLNVWTPALNDGRKRPVMFWCHGGGFRTGSGSSERYDGTNLCLRGDVVVVTINHRLNVLGFAHLSDVAGPEFAESGTVGVTDIVHALRWVRTNIERFGGDPNTVMIYGQSGGGRKVATLLAMPSAKGLFHRAINESGPSIRLVERDQANVMATRLLAELGIPKTRARDLQTVPLDRMMAAYFATSRGMEREQLTSGFAPVVDGRVIVQHPFHPTAAAVSADVPVIFGSNRTEMTLQLQSDTAAFSLDEAGMHKRVQEFLGDRANAVLGVYRKANPGASPSDLFFLTISDHNYGAPIMKMAERRAALQRAPAYLYYFRWPTPVEGVQHGRTPHSLEIPFVFDNVVTAKAITGAGPDAIALADKMSEAWIQFARTGDPSVPKLPQWPAYDAAERSTMVFDNTCRVERDPLRESRLAMQRAMDLL